MDEKNQPIPADSADILRQIADSLARIVALYKADMRQREAGWASQEIERKAWLEYQNRTHEQYEKDAEEKKRRGDKILVRWPLPAFWALLLLLMALVAAILFWTLVAMIRGESISTPW